MVDIMNGFMFQPDCRIPNIRYKDADEIYVENGRYPRGGYRFAGQYQDLAGLHKFWDVSARTAVDIDAEYSAGATSGMLGSGGVGAKVNSSWYSLFLMASTPIVLALPYVRVDTIAYSADTTITPAAHADGTTAANGFIVANDAWNGYRLVKLDVEDAAYDGAVYTIADTVDATPDEIHITGDITSQVAAADWLQLIPPVNVDCCYLGTIQINSSGNISEFSKTEWVTSFPKYDDHQVQLTKNTVASNVETGTHIPPIAKRADIQIILSETTACRGVIIRIYSGSSGSNQQLAHRWYRGSDGAVGVTFNQSATFDIYATSVMRNMAVYNANSTDTETAISGGGLAYVGIQSFWE